MRDLVWLKLSKITLPTTLFAIQFGVIYEIMNIFGHQSAFEIVLKNVLRWRVVSSTEDIICLFNIVVSFSSMDCVFNRNAESNVIVLF